MSSPSPGLPPSSVEQLKEEMSNIAAEASRILASIKKV